jgi:hypothetical protein
MWPVPYPTVSSAITGRFVGVIAVWGTRQEGMKLHQKGYYAFIHFYYLWAARWARLEQSAHTHILWHHTNPQFQLFRRNSCYWVSRNIAAINFPLKPPIFRTQRNMCKTNDNPHVFLPKYLTSSYM